MDSQQKYLIVLIAVLAGLVYLLFAFGAAFASNPKPCNLTASNGTSIMHYSSLDLKTSGIVLRYAMLNPLGWGNITNYANKQCQILIAYNINAINPTNITPSGR